MTRYGANVVRAVAFVTLVASVPAGADEALPLEGLAHVAFKVSRLDRAHAFYTGILGYEEAFRIRDGREPITQSFLKVNDDQFIRLDLVSAPVPDDRLAEVAFRTKDVARVRATLASRGLSPSTVSVRGDGNPYVTLIDPDGHTIAFVQYAPDGRQAQTSGHLLNPRRVSTELWHVGVAVAQEARAMAWYRDKLGFSEFWRGGREPDRTSWIHMRIPGPRDNYFEFVLYDDPPPDRQRLGSMHHICLLTPDLHAALAQAQRQGLRDAKPTVGRIRRRLCSLRDPDGSRVEFMERRYVP